MKRRDNRLRARFGGEGGGVGAPRGWGDVIKSRVRGAACVQPETLSSNPQTPAPQAKAACAAAEQRAVEALEWAGAWELRAGEVTPTPESKKQNPETGTIDFEYLGGAEALNSSPLGRQRGRWRRWNERGRGSSARGR